MGDHFHRFIKDKVDIQYLHQKKNLGIPITMLTAYDFPTAVALDKSGIDAILIGDSIAMVVLGHENTLSISMNEMINHCKAVARGTKRAFLIGDMPFMSYQVSVTDAIRNAGRFIQEGGVDAIKLEGGREKIDTIKAIIDSGIPVMGHLGLTPQSLHQLGGFSPQGKTAETAERIVQDSLLLDEAGCFGIVLESIPARLAGYITKKLTIPTIGIGAGTECDGQVLVTQDMLGLYEKSPRFVRKYANLSEIIAKAFNDYISEVENKIFPGIENTVDMINAEWETFLGRRNEENI